MTRDEQLEFRISQYADGTLPPADRAALEAELATNAEARRLLAEYRSLDALLVSAAPTPPEIDWDRLARHLSARVAEEGAAAEVEEPARVIRLSAYFRRAAVAVAALVAVAVGSVVWFQNSRPRAEVTVGPVAPQGETAGGAQAHLSRPAPRPAEPPVVVVEGPRVEPRPGPEVAVVSVGPAPTADLAARLGEGVVTTPSRVVWIASGPRAAHDSEAAPF